MHLGVLVLALVLFFPPLAAEAQQPRKTPRVGVLASASPEDANPAYGLRDGLRELGYVEGQNVAIEWRWLRGDDTRSPDLATELVRLKVDVIVAVNNPATLAAQRATKTIPIIMVIARDPVRSGFAATLARPGGNITGLTTQAPELSGKRVQLLKEAVPNLSRLAVLWDPALTGMQQSVRETEIAAKALGSQVQVLEARSPSELVRAFDEMARERADAVVVQGSDMLFTHRARIAERAVKSRLPAICAFREYVEAGCLMSYAASLIGQYRRAAYFVDRILKGAKPADLPIEQPTKFELVINSASRES